MKGPLREFARYTSLNVLGMLALSCYILADTFFVSLGLGADGLAALNLAIPIYSFINGSGLMIGMGGGTRYSILRSQGDRQEADQTFTQALYLAGAFSLLFMAAGALFAGDIVRLFGGTGQVFTMSRTYLRVILLFSPAFLMNNVLLCFVRNDGAPQLAMTAMIVGSLSNVVLDWVFIFPLGMGILGAVLATGWAPILSIAILSAHFWRKHNQFRLVPCKPQGQLLGRILSSGAPSLVTEVSSGIVMIVFNTLILSLEGNIGVAAYGVIANLSLVVIAMFTGIAQGMQPILSQGYGRGDTKGLSSILRYGLLTTVVLSALIYGLMAAFAPQIAWVFNSENDPTLQEIATQGLRLYFTACPFAGCNVVLSMYFTSTERPRPAHAISLLRGFFIILPLAFGLAWLGGMTGIWLAFPVTEFLVAILAAALLIRCKRPAKKS